LKKSVLLSAMLVGSMMVASAHAGSNQWSPTCNFFGFASVQSGPNQVAEYTAESFEREVTFDCKGDVQVSVTATTIYNGKIVAARVVDYWHGLGVKRTANAWDNGFIDALVGDTIVLEFAQPVSLDAVQFSYWDNTTGLDITDFVEVSVENGGTVVLGTTGTYNLKDTVANFNLANMVGTKFFIKAVGKNGKELASSSFRLAGFRATPELGID
jgi:hypothetical protein